MNARMSLTTGRKRTWLAPLLALVLLAGVATAADRFLVPEELPGPPYYASLGWFLNNDWAFFVFCRSPECVPNSANLLQAYDFDLLDPTVGLKYPLLMEGFALYEEGQDPFVVKPYQLELHNVEGVPVPIWFISVEDLWQCFGSKLTVDKLAQVPSLRKGWAYSYKETTHEGGAATVAKVDLVASGVLEDGPSFFMHVESKEVGEPLFILRFE